MPGWINKADYGTRLFLGCGGSQPVPWCLAGHVDLLGAYLADAGPENGNHPGGLGTDIEGGVHNPGRHEDAIPRTENTLLTLDPMLDGAGNHKDEFFLVGVIMEAVSPAGGKGPFEHSELFRPRGGWIAQPAEPHKVQLSPLDVTLEHELARHGHLRCPPTAQLGLGCAQTLAKGNISSDWIVRIPCAA